MNSFSSKADLPSGLTLEKPSRNLASLATTEALVDLRHVVTAQWRCGDVFERLAKHGIRPVDRLLFYGPPGNGKTMASQWLAREIDAPLYRVRCEALIQSFFGRTAANVGEIMAWLEHQGRCIVLWDEVETIFPSRAFGTDQCDREMHSAMGVFWQFLDRWDAPTLFILATNMPERLDPALVSRIDEQLEFGPPSRQQSAKVAAYWAEVLHEFGGGEWGAQLADRKWESFRALFQAIQSHIRKHVTAESPPTTDL